MHNEVVIGGNPLDRIVRWVLTVWLLLVIVLPIWLFGGDLWSGSVPWAAIACLYAVWLARVRLTADPLTRRYVWVRGVAPVLIRRAGSLDEFSYLLMRGEERHGHGGKYVVYWLTLERRDGSQKRPVFWYSHSNYAPNATQLAERLGLPIQYRDAN